MITRQDRNQVFGPTGALIAEEVVQTDITTEAVAADIRNRVRQALTANQAFLDLPSPNNVQVLAQVRQLTREVNGLIRLLTAADLLVETTDI